MPAETYHIAKITKFCQSGLGELGFDCRGMFYPEVGSGEVYCERCRPVLAAMQARHEYGTSLQGRCESVAWWLQQRETHSPNPGDSPEEIIRRFDAGQTAKKERHQAQK